MKRSIVSLSAVFVLMSGIALAGSPASAQPAPMTEEEFVALPLEEQSGILTPLQEAAEAVDAQGRGASADIYAGVELDAPAAKVKLYITEPSRAGALLEAAERDSPGVDLSMIDVVAAKHTKNDLRSAREKLAPQADKYHIVSMSVKTDGAGLRVATDSPAGFSSVTDELSREAGVPVDVVPGEAVEAKSRLADTSPYVAGGRIRIDTRLCTTGIPVRKNGSNKPYIVTASHCGRTGNLVRNGGGVYEGTISEYQTRWDAALYPVKDVEAYEWDGHSNNSRIVPLKGTSYSLKGNYVCQDGYTSGVVCNIKVYDDDIWTRVSSSYPTFEARGVAGQKMGGGKAVQAGDSGGLVFALNGGANKPRKVLGLVSAEHRGSETNMFWTEAKDIYRAFNVHLT
ncbi:hypothetical protein [Streptomyces sp. NPDC003077]|uniref:hypothetical protein n=1 Tax=Streptomyces sp. NPDC003077 TaxID=3154443 RepID=UPI0033ABC553